MLTLIHKQALGLDTSMLVEWQQSDAVFYLHPTVIKPLQQLQAEAKRAGFDLQIVSAHRNFNRQLNIWNAKASGLRALLDYRGQELDYSILTEKQKLQAIMRWSAVPGMSRHHWGTDFDIFDAKQICLSDVKLTPSEVEGNGACAAMHKWLGERIAANSSFDFFRPYQVDSGGIAPEVWHLSFLPTAINYQRAVTLEKLYPLWKESGLLLLDQLTTLGEEELNAYIHVNLAEQYSWVKATFNDLSNA